MSASKKVSTDVCTFTDDDISPEYDNVADDDDTMFDDEILHALKKSYSYQQRSKESSRHVLREAGNQKVIVNVNTNYSIPSLRRLEHCRMLLKDWMRIATIFLTCWVYLVSETPKIFIYMQAMHFWKILQKY